MKKGSSLVKSPYKDHKEYSRLLQFEINFGGKRSLILKRDNFSCIKCGLTQKEHFLKYNRDITVDHIDRDRANNSESNLQTLCLNCHGKKDAAQAVRNRHNFSSKYIGVSWTKDRSLWAAHYYIDRKQFHVGYFKDEEAAKIGRQKALDKRMAE